MNPTRDLQDLLITMFEDWEFRTFFRYRPRYQGIEPFLPAEGTPFAKVIEESVRLLARKGLIDNKFFEYLLEERPLRRTEIVHVQQIISSPEGGKNQYQAVVVGENEKFPPCDVLLVTATTVEIRALLKCARARAQHDERPRFGRHTYLYLGCIGGAHAYAVRSEMGIGTPGGSLLTVRNAIASLNPGAAIMVGVAFGFDEQRQQIGDVLVSRQLHHYAPDRIGTNEDGSPRIIPRGSRVDASGWVLDRFRLTENSWTGRVKFGLMLSGESLVDNTQFRANLLAREPEAIGGEMEGAGLYAAAWDTRTPWALVKAICDWADGRKGEADGERQQKAAETSSEFVLSSLAQGGFCAANRPS